MEMLQNTLEGNKVKQLSETELTRNIRMTTIFWRKVHEDN